jgi:hypothetical protein
MVHVINQKRSDSRSTSGFFLEHDVKHRSSRPRSRVVFIKNIVTEIMYHSPRDKSEKI